MHKNAVKKYETWLKTRLDFFDAVDMLSMFPLRDAQNRIFSIYSK